MYAFLIKKTIDGSFPALLLLDIQDSPKKKSGDVFWKQISGGMMGFLSFIKGMKVEDNRPINVVFRTSKTCGFLGFSLIFAGTSLALQVLCGNAFFCYFNFVMIGSLGLAFLFTFLGLLVATYRKCVILSKSQSRVEYIESSLFCWRRATYHFSEIEQVEVCRLEECLLSSRCSIWTIKAYIRRMEQLETVKLFEGIDNEKTEEAASVLSEILGKETHFVTGNLFTQPLPETF